MAKMFYDNDANLDVLKGRTVAVLGYGSQGHAQAQTWGIGCQCYCGLRKGSKSWAAAEAAGLQVMTVAEAAQAANVIPNPAAG